MTIESSLGGAFSTNNATLSLDFDGSVTFPEVLPYPIASVYEDNGSYKIYFEEGSPAVFAVNVVGSASQVEFLKHFIKNTTISATEKTFEYICFKLEIGNKCSFLFL